MNCRLNVCTLCGCSCGRQLTLNRSKFRTYKYVIILFTNWRCSNINSKRVCSYITNSQEGIGSRISWARISMLGSIIILITLEYNRISSQFDLITIREPMTWNSNCSNTRRSSICNISWGVLCSIISN